MFTDAKSPWSEVMVVSQVVEIPWSLKKSTMDPSAFTVGDWSLPFNFFLTVVILIWVLG